MKTAWVVLLISALTDAMLAAGGGFMALLTADAALPADQKMVWTWTVIAVPLLTGGGVFLRTIQQALKTTVATIAELRGIPFTTVTRTPSATVTKTPEAAIVTGPTPPPGG